MGDGSIEAGDHRPANGVVREDQARGDGATQRALAERAGSRLEPRHACAALVDRCDDRSTRHPEAADAAHEAITHNRRGADPMAEKRIRRDEELLHARARTLPDGPVSRLRASSSASTNSSRARVPLLLLSEPAESAAHGRAEERAGDPVEEDIALGQRLVRRRARARQEAPVLQAHQGDRAHSPVQLGKHVVGHAHPPRRILSK